MRPALFFIATVWVFLIFAQSTDLPLNTRSYQYFDRWDIVSTKINIPTVKPISRKWASQALELVDLTNSIDRLNATFVKNETREYFDSTLRSKKPFLSKLYRYPSDFYSYEEKEFDLHLNPVFYAGGGRQNGNDELLFDYYRGIELRGSIDQKIAFYSLLTENQARFPDYVQNFTDSTLAIPYEGFWKQYQDTGVDFLRAQGYVDLNLTNHISGQFGYGKHFVGNGMRSLILSDFSNNYPYLRLSTEVWKVRYTNVFAQLIGQTAGGSFGLSGVGEFPRKFMSFHHLSVDLSDKFNIGLFESVIFGRPDSLGTNSYKPEYLIPVIFIRALEQQSGSADNVIIGLDFKWNLWNTISMYGQLVIDELIVSETLDGTGWWGSKQALQLGLKYQDIMSISHLNGQIEWNTARPYTYTHRDLYTSYTHYNMPLAHPLGANFRELLGRLSYQPLPKINLSGTLLLATYGNDLDRLSYGRNVQRTYEDRPESELRGISIGYGDETTLTLAQGVATYFWKHNASFDLSVIYRREKSAIRPLANSSTIFAITFRWNFPFRSYLF